MKTVYEWKREKAGMRKVVRLGGLIEATVDKLFRTEMRAGLVHEVDYFEAVIAAQYDSDYQEFDTEAEAIAWCEAEITGRLEAAGLKLLSDTSPA